MTDEDVGADFAHPARVYDCWLGGMTPGSHGVKGCFHTISIASAQCLHMPAAVLRGGGACYHWTIKRRCCAAAAADPGSGTAYFLVVS
jgi:hypothetical protein